MLRASSWSKRWEGVGAPPLLGTPVHARNLLLKETTFGKILIEALLNLAEPSVQLNSKKILEKSELFQ